LISSFYPISIRQNSYIFSIFCLQISNNIPLSYQHNKNLTTLLEDNMTIYFNPYYRGIRRHPLAQLMNEIDSEYEPQIAFPIDVKVLADSYEIKALLPGIDVDDLEIQIVNEVITISGEMKVNRDSQSDYIVSELPAGKFHRVISLPTPLNSNEVEAVLESGILTLIVPKAEEARPKSIKIQRK